MNVFIDFDLLKDAINISKDNLIKELDILIAARNRIHVWSRSHSPYQMYKECSKIEILMPEEEIELKNEITKLRKEGKTFKEIADNLKIETKRVGYYINTKADTKFVLDDWIFDYHKKSSEVYPKVDYVIDTDNKFVKKFIKHGIDGRAITPDFFRN